MNIKKVSPNHVVSQNVIYAKELNLFFQEAAFKQFYSVNKVIIAFLCVVFFSLFIVNLDITIAAKGKIVPSDSLKTVQSLYPGKVKTIFYKEGALLKKGDVIIEVDPAEENANLKKTEADIAEKKEHIALIERFSGSIHDVKKTDLFIQSLISEKKSTVQQIVIKRAQNFLSNIKRIESRKIATQNEALRLKEKLRGVLSVIRSKQEKLSGCEELLKKGYISKLMYFTVQEELITAQNQESDTRSALNTALHEEEMLQKEASLLVSSISEGLENEMLSLSNALREDQNYFEKAALTKENRFLRAPIDGYLDKLNITGVGEVVSPSDKIAVMTPISGGLEVECYVQSRDIGFVQEGQNVIIKVDAFPYSIHGTIHGKIVWISKTAFQEGELFLYKAKVVYGNNSESLKLSSGMTVECNVITGNRKIIHYFISPIYEVFSNGLKER
jgi:hemolysin D